MTKEEEISRVDVVSAVKFKIVKAKQQIEFFERFLWTGYGNCVGWLGSR